MLEERDRVMPALIAAEFVIERLHIDDQPFRIAPFGIPAKGDVEALNLTFCGAPRVLR